MAASGGGAEPVACGHPLHLPTATDRPGGGLPAVGRVPEGGPLVKDWSREEGAPLPVLVVDAGRAALPHLLPLPSPRKWLVLGAAEWWLVAVPGAG